jgi:hypothetical protein
MTPEEIAALSSPSSGTSLAAPISRCSGDPDYMRFTARVDGLLPRSFASFDRGSIDFRRRIRDLEELLSRSRDLRLLTPLAKLRSSIATRRLTPRSSS